MSGRRLVVLWLLAVAIAVVGEGGFFLNRFAPYETIPLDLSVGFVTMAAGVVTWSRRPGNRIGPMLFVAGAAWSLAGVWSYGVWPYWKGPVSEATPWSDTLIVVGVLLLPVHFTLLVHLLFAYPEGHLRSRLDRALVGGLYAFVALFVVTIMADPVDNSLLALNDQAPLPPFLEAVQSNYLGVVALAALFILSRRWLKATPTARRILTPVLGAALLVAAVELVAAVARAGALSPPAEPIFYANVVAKLSVPVGFLFGLLRGMIERSGVGSLVIELGAPKGTGVRDALAHTLHDPSVELTYWLPAKGEFVDAAGRKVSLPAEGSARAVTIVEREGVPLAAIIHDRSLLEEPGLVEAASAAAGLAIDNERLKAGLRAKLEEVRASRARIVEAGDAGRRRVERNLHDGAQQRLVTLSLTVGMVREHLDHDGGPGIVAELDAISEEVHQTIEELRELGRGIHPAILAEEGLTAGVESLAERSPVPVSIEGPPIDRLPEPVEVAAYFVVAEALTNVAKYSHAKHVTVRLARRGRSLEVDVIDDGVGGADPTGGSGLRGLEDRVAAMGGELRLESRAGAGTRVHAEIPCDGR